MSKKNSFKDIFTWYLPITEENIEYIWNKGIVTVDANVLLDLYRYRQETKDLILDTLSQFDKRLWLSYQVAEEFIRNRLKVIHDTDKEHIEAKKQLISVKETIFSSLDKIKGKSYTRIPKEKYEKFKIDIEEKIESLISDINNIIDERPNYVSDDPILFRILELFSNLGESYSQDELSDIEKEGEKRYNKNIPPGYKDKNKDDNKYGDFILWKQLLNYGKKENKPIIFITSDQKEDWWEIIGGKTIGLRPELKKEAWNEIGNYIIAYQVDSFLFAAKQYGGKSKLNNESDELERAIDDVVSIQKKRGVVNVTEHIIEEKSILHNKGKLICHVHKPTRNFTISGKLEPNLLSIPEIKVNLEESPSNITNNYYVRTGAGTLHDFNIHILSKNSDLLPIGKYVFNYDAIIPDSDFYLFQEYMDQEFRYDTYDD